MDTRDILFSLRKYSARVVLLLLVALAAPWAASSQQATSAPVKLQSSDKTLSIRADSQDRGKDVSRLRGHVEVTYRGMKLTADEVTYNEASGEVVATGHVYRFDHWSFAQISNFSPIPTNSTLSLIFEYCRRSNGNKIRCALSSSRVCPPER